MQSSYLSILAVFVIAILTGIACEGPTGPQGPQGSQGEPGTANVIYSEWMAADWNYLDEPDQKIMYIEEPLVSGDFMNAGILLGYFQSPDSGIVQALPYANYTISIHPIIIDREINGVDYKGIFITAEQRDGTINPPPLPSWVEDIQIRYVIIPEGVPAKMPPGFFEDYQAMKEYYGILD